MDYGVPRLSRNWFAWVFLVLFFIISFYWLSFIITRPSNHQNIGETQGVTTTLPKNTTTNLYTVLSVTDGDTIRINYNGANIPLRLIGVDTPETVDERTTVQCFGEEASNYLKNKLVGKKVSIESDSTQSDRDKYDRLLRYVYLDGEDIGLSIIANGYGHEYTYNVPYIKQSEYIAAEKKAEAENLGLWAPNICSSAQTTKEESESSETSSDTECVIKGNINNKGDKIYHMPGQQYYDETVITPSKGERFFCTEQEAIDAGWRKSKV